LPLGDQETQEHAKCRDTTFDCSPPAGATLLENKCSQPAGIEAGWVLSKPSEQLANVNAIVFESPITGTPLLVHPLTESRQQNGLLNRRLNRWKGDDPGISQAGQEQARAMDHLQSLRWVVVWAAASTQVVVKSRKRLLVQLTHGHAMPMGPIDELLHHSEMFASSPPGITSLR
jgi:hypothetical protein